MKFKYRIIKSTDDFNEWLEDLNEYYLTSMSNRCYTAIFTEEYWHTLPDEYVVNRLIKAGLEEINISSCGSWHIKPSDNPNDMVATVRLSDEPLYMLGEDQKTTIHMADGTQVYIGWDHMWTMEIRDYEQVVKDEDGTMVGGANLLSAYALAAAMLRVAKHPELIDVIAKFAKEWGDDQEFPYASFNNEIHKVVKTMLLTKSS